ncbi:MAG: phosphoenolpyruvate carboxykinase (ATP) [Planctomycetes bacterium]|nr:phosphoenolpyruvate carboxykinase (ATP) [Planctomycetota bacterium]
MDVAHHHGLCGLAAEHRNLGTAALCELALLRGEGRLAAGGPLVVLTGKHTGRAAQDKFIVEDAETRERVWWTRTNAPMSEDHFRDLKARMLAFFQGREAFVQDLHAGADPDFRLRVRVVTQMAWHSLFARTLLVRPPADAEVAGAAAFTPDYTIIHAPDFLADPKVHGTRSGTFIAVGVRDRTVLIGGTGYAGEIKKSVFTLLNFLLPARGVMPMHAAATVGKRGDVALFFGLSGTGKTTLSADSTRTLIGDDEHGWSAAGVFNFEGGCYAKVIRLSPEAEPEIFATTRRFGTILENVAMDPVTRRLDLADAGITENTRAAYPLDFIANASDTGRAGHARNVIFLTCDAFGVLPPIARLSPAQAMYHFISGYTAKVAGTEKGVSEPAATFSTCFGAPFMPLHSFVYADLLAAKVREHRADCWLVNTGWTGGPCGVGRRMPIAHTRALVNAALAGSLARARFAPHPVFGVEVPDSCPGVPEAALRAEGAWSDPAAYDAQAARLAGLFHENFKQFASGCSAEVKAAGPRAHR